MSKGKESIPKIGITIGDINGIGPEVIIKALRDQRILNHITPVVYGSTKTLSYYRKNYYIDDFQYTQLKDPNSLIPKKVNVVNCWEDMLEITAGKSSESGAKSSRMALQKAMEDLKSGFLDALVTGPINKHNIQAEDFNFPGHTEFLTAQFDVKDSLMLLVAGELRIGVVTGHIPLKDIPTQITISRIESKLEIMENSLKNDFAIQKPRIAVLGLNPHNGDHGLMGNEEENIITPLINKQRENGKLVFGPYPADGFFGDGKHHQYDAVLAMYHDQGLIPFKTLAFDTGVNFTAGLPVIRTSPDHGTAYSIAGTNKASENSMREAIFLAYDLWKNRNR